MQYLLVLLICLGCLPVIIKRLKYYRKKMQLLKKLKAGGHKLYVLDETRLPMLSFSLVFLLAFILAYIYRENIQAVCLWTVVGMISISEMINTQLVRKNYYGKNFFVYFHRQFKYSDIVEMELKKNFLLADAYVVRTKDNSYFNVTERFHEILKKGRNRSI